MSTWTHSPTCCTLRSPIDLISGVSCPPALYLLIRNPVKFSWAYIFPFLFLKQYKCFEGILDYISWSFSIFMWDIWKDSPPLTAYSLRRSDPRPTLQNGKDLPGSQHLSPFPSLVLHWPQLKSKPTGTLDFDDPSHGNFQSWSVLPPHRGRASQNS